MYEAALNLRSGGKSTTFIIRCETKEKAQILAKTIVSFWPQATAQEKRFLTDIQTAQLPIDYIVLNGKAELNRFFEEQQGIDYIARLDKKGRYHIIFAASPPSVKQALTFEAGAIRLLRKKQLADMEKTKRKKRVTKEAAQNEVPQPITPGPDPEDLTMEIKKQIQPYMASFSEALGELQKEIKEIKEENR